ncbi:Fic family protein [Pseudomonas delhiensis]|uniref:Fic family protein n=1 Tax=Pseudomonas delhiensis TaxID=366289 RepID=UPI00315AA87D
MESQFVGYAFLVEALKLKVFPIQRPAAIRPVTRIEPLGRELAVPQRLAPPPGDCCAHVLFALKHEGINLGVLAQALPQIPAATMLAELRKAPSGAYIRKACYLWEAFSGTRLPHDASPKGATTPLFDPARYVTGPAQRNARWRVDFNGLGTLHYCATVERIPEIKALLELDILGKSREFIGSLPAGMMDRALSWAYLHETQDSFAIEREAPSADKAERFVQLLRQAHERQPLTEDYLVALQNSTISNPFNRAAAFRHEQNHLSNGLRGAAGVTYVPPPPELCRDLMGELMQFANEAPMRIDPLVAAGIISFGFVFLHPFMDGNGRLSRFLIHQALCRSGAMSHGLLLPVSVAMKREEQRYLEALQSFSRPAREFWRVLWLDADDLSFEFTGNEGIYRYWDATPCVAFTLEMARQALEVELHEETEFLQAYDLVFKAVDAHYDVRGSDLAQLVMMCLSNNGIVSRNRRKQFQYSVPEEVFDFIEEQAREVLAEQVARKVDTDKSAFLSKI